MHLVHQTLPGWLWPASSHPFQRTDSPRSSTTALCHAFPAKKSSTIGDASTHRAGNGVGPEGFAGFFPAPFPEPVAEGVPGVDSAEVITNQSIQVRASSLDDSPEESVGSVRGMPSQRAP